MEDITKSSEFETVLKMLFLCVPGKTIEALAYAEEEDICFFHLGLGAWIRNNLLSPDAALFEFFVENGITCADDMSGLIIRKFYMLVRRTY